MTALRKQTRAAVADDLAGGMNRRNRIAGNTFGLCFSQWRGMRSQPFLGDTKVLIHVDSEKKEAAISRRTSAGDWAEICKGAEETIALPKIGAELPPAEFYEAVDFPAHP